MGKITVIGAGAWGTAFAIHLARCGNDVKLWVRESDLLERMKTTRINDVFLPKFSIDKGIIFTDDLTNAVDYADFIFWAVPTQFLRKTVAEVEVPANKIHIVLSKGIERENWSFPYQILEQKFDGRAICVLSGPSFADEVARGLPTVLVSSSYSAEIAHEIQHLAASERLRIYRSDDPLGVSLGGAYKNIIAIAAGISDGLKLGQNTRAALITRGLSEMVRLAEALGAKRDTIFGAAGVGDMILTATSRTSRNFSVGERIGAGEKFSRFKNSMVQVAEGAFSTFGAMYFAEKFGIELPIAEEVHKILWADRDPKLGVQTLMTRPLKKEW